MAYYYSLCMKFSRYIGLGMSHVSFHCTLLSFVRFLQSNSGDEGIRTPDPLLARQVLSQLSYTPKRVSIYFHGLKWTFPSSERFHSSNGLKWTFPSSERFHLS